MKHLIKVGLLSAMVLNASHAFAQGTLTEGKLSVGTDLTYPPYNYFDDAKKPAGFDVELMSAIAEKAGINVEFLDTRFENLILGVNGSQFDLIASTLYVKPDRAKVIDYIPYMKTGVSIAVATGSGNSFASPDNLCGVVVGSIKGAAWLEEFTSMNKGICASNPIDSREFPTSPEATQALLSGGIQAQVEDSAVLGNAVITLNGRIEVSSKEQFYPVIVGFGVKKGNDELAKVIRSAIDELESDGTYQTLLDRYNVDRPTDEDFKKAVGQ
ncbi:MAG: ABC transporter substrate-binding protein [Rhizobiaceae bacterium]|nr:ABC transporter substrate-binding protein [Rhizobiaceae bacterium]